MIGIKHKLTICFYLITQKKKKKGKRTRDIILTCKFWSQPNLQFAFIQLLKKKKGKENERGYFKFVDRVQRWSIKNKGWPNSRFYELDYSRETFSRGGGEVEMMVLGRRIKKATVPCWRPCLWNDCVTPVSGRRVTAPTALGGLAWMDPAREAGPSIDPLPFFSLVYRIRRRTILFQCQI